MAQNDGQKMDDYMEESVETNKDYMDKDDSMDYPELFIPMSEEYEIPNTGSAMIYFDKISDEEGGSKVKIKKVEMEDVPGDGIEIEEGMDTMDHVNNFLEKRS